MYLGRHPLCTAYSLTLVMLWELFFLSSCVFKLLPGVPQEVRMNVGVAHSEGNPNTRVMNSRGIWLTYALGVGMLHIVLLSIPFFSVPLVWTLTNVIHNLVSPPSFTAAGLFIARCVFTQKQSQHPEVQGKRSAWRNAQVSCFFLFIYLINLSRQKEKKSPLILVFVKIIRIIIFTVHTLSQKTQLFSASHLCLTLDCFVQVYDTHTCLRDVILDWKRLGPKLEHVWNATCF